MKNSIGKGPDGGNIYLFTLSRGKTTVTITNYGGTITGISVPDREGRIEDVVLGFDTVEEYFGAHPYFGVTVGRYANRIGNAAFTLDGARYDLSANDSGRHHLHGGPRGFDRMTWEEKEHDDRRLVLTCHSPRGHEGYPGNLDVTLTFGLTDDGSLSLRYQAETDAATPVNLTNHSYFNLAPGSESILGHVLYINADSFTEVDDSLIPTGRVVPVRGTPLDFTEPKPMGKDLHLLTDGYDHNYVLSSGGDIAVTAALVHEAASGRCMEVYTSMPGMQFYSGNFLDGTIKGKMGTIYGRHAGFCLETQFFPDSPNRPEFPSCILRPGEKYDHTTIYRFSVK